MKMNTLCALGLAAALVASASPITALAQSVESASEQATELTGPQDAVYTFYNTTGEDIVALYVYATPKETEEESTEEGGTIGDALQDAADGAKDLVENAIDNAADAFSDEDATEDAVEETEEVIDPIKGKNLVGKDGLADGESIEYAYTVDAADIEDVQNTVEFTTKSGYTGKFTTLHFETVPISLIAEDAVSGATEIAFGLPQTTEATTEAK